MSPFALLPFALLSGQLLNDNPVVSDSRLQDSVRLLFWNGPEEINVKDRTRRPRKACDIQWDHKNIVNCKGVLERLKQASE